MGNCISSEDKMRHELPVPNVHDDNDGVDEFFNGKANEIERKFMTTDEERMLEIYRRREENKRKEQEYNLEELRETLHEDMDTFLLNNILLSVQLFKNFDRDRQSFAKIRQKEQSRLNGEGPGGGLSSQRHRKRASLPDTMQEMIGRWVSLDLSEIRNSTQNIQNQNTKRNNTSFFNALDGRKAFLAPLRIMIVHEDVRVVETDEKGLSRAIIPESSMKPGYVRLCCIGDWKDESNEIYNKILQDKVPEIHEDTEESEYQYYMGSERIESDYSYSSQFLYEKSRTQGSNTQENLSSLESEEEEDSFNSPQKAGTKTAVSSISQRPPMMTPQFLNSYPEEENEAHFQGQQNIKLGNGIYSSSSNVPNFQNPFPKMAVSTCKEIDNFTLATTDGFGNIRKGFNSSPKPSISTENSDSDYGYATIPPSYSPPKSAMRHGGIPLQCLTEVPYRSIDGKEVEEEDLEGNKGEELARRNNLEHLYIKKTFLDPTAFLKAFGEEVRWRESTYYSSANTTTSNHSRNNLEVPNSLEEDTRMKRQSKTTRYDGLDKISIRSMADFEDDSLQAILGIPTNVPIMKKGGSWISQRDIHGMRFPIEITPSIAVPWPDSIKVEWGMRKRNHLCIDTRTNERRPAWPSKKVDEAKKTLCHAIASDLTKIAGKGDDKLGWKLCFCEAERIIEEDLTHKEIRCLLFMFLLRKCYLEWDNIALSHKFVRTVFYWQCERGNINYPEEEMGKNIRVVLKAMFRALSRGKLEDYFMRKRNLADDESETAVSRSIAALKKINEVLSIHVARAVSALRFSDPKVPKLDFKKLVEILTEESTVKMVNPKLFQSITNNDDSFEDDQTRELEKLDSSTQIQNTKIKKRENIMRFNPPNMNMEKIQGKSEDADSVKHSQILAAEFSRTGKRYVINPDTIITEDKESASPIKQKTTTVTVITGTISAKKTNLRPEISDVFDRIKRAEKEKADREREWKKKLINDLEMAKKKKEEKGSIETRDIFLEAEKYKPEDVAGNPVRRHLILSLFAKHFADLGHRCCRDWEAIKEADLYLRHAENLTILLKEHEEYHGIADDSNEGQGEATRLMNYITQEFKELTNLKMKKLRIHNIHNKERFKRAQNKTSDSSLSDLRREIKITKNASNSVFLKPAQPNNGNNEIHINSSDEDVHF